MTIRWSYALNQWNSGHDLFVLAREHEVAFKTVSISGFEAVEIEAGSGRWEPLGRREWVERHYGSVRKLRDLISACALSGVSSYSFDPALPIFEEGAFGRTILDLSHHAAIARTVGETAELAVALGGTLVVARAMPAFAATSMPVGEAVRIAADGWNLAGRRAAEEGARLALSVDALSVLRGPDVIGALLDRCDPDVVGLSIDTAAMVIAGIDPIDLYRRFAARAWHVRLKNTRYVDEGGEYRLPFPEQSLISGGGRRGIERWYYELGDHRGLVDVAGFYAALVDGGYDGWIVVESDQSPVPATSVMLNGWFKERLVGAECQR